MIRCHLVYGWFDPKTTSQRFVPLPATKVNDDLGVWKIDHGHQGNVIMEKVGKPANNKKYFIKKTWVELKRGKQISNNKNGAFTSSQKKWVHWKGSILFPTLTCTQKNVIFRDGEKLQRHPFLSWRPRAGPMCRIVVWYAPMTDSHGTRIVCIIYRHHGTIVDFYGNMFFGVQ